MVSVEEAAVLLGQSKSSLYRAIARGELPFPVIKIGGRHRISRRAIERVIDGEPGVPVGQPRGATGPSDFAARRTRTADRPGSACPDESEGPSSVPM